MNRIDVIVPCYKYANYLRSCVKSVLSQERVSVRVLILDDCSPDQTPAVAATLLEEDARVEYRRHVTNHGHIATYNEGLDWVTGEFTLLLSADDALTNGALYRATKVMNDHPEVGFVFGKRVLLYGESMAPSEPTYAEGWNADIMPGTQFIDMMCRLPSNPVCTPTAVVRSSVQRGTGYYRAELPHTGDLEMWMRCAVHAAVGRLDSDQAYWRRHEENMRWQFIGPNDIHQHRAAYDFVFGQHGALIPNLSELREIVYQRLAEEAFWRANGSFERGMTPWCNEYLRLAMALDPNICHLRSWSRLKFKRAVGLTLWSRLARTRSWLSRWTRGALTAPCGEETPSRWIA